MQITRIMIIVLFKPSVPLTKNNNYLGVILHLQEQSMIQITLRRRGAGTHGLRNDLHLKGKQDEHEQS